VAFTLTDLADAPATKVLLSCTSSAKPVETDNPGLNGAPTPVGTCSYTVPGTYKVGVSVYDKKVLVYSNSMTVVAVDPVALDDLLRSLWSGMNNALVAGNQTGALSYLDIPAQAIYGPVFSALSTTLPKLIPTYSDLTTIQLADSTGEYLINLNVKGKQNSFLVNFVNTHGIWQIDGM
jgi:hypothetical protein